FAHRTLSRSSHMLTNLVSISLRPPRPTVFPYTTLFRSVSIGLRPPRRPVGSLGRDAERGASFHHLTRRLARVGRGGGGPGHPPCRGLVAGEERTASCRAVSRPLGHGGGGQRGAPPRQSGGRRGHDRHQGVGERRRSRRDRPGGRRLDRAGALGGAPYQGRQRPRDRMAYPGGIPSPAARSGGGSRSG